MTVSQQSSRYLPIADPNSKTWKLIQNILLYQSIIIISISAAISTNGQHPAFSSAVPNYALSDKIFQTETEVAESYKCLVMCQLDTRCKSFNFSQKEKICEMNTATKKEFPRSYGPRNNYSYYHLSSGIIKVARRRSELWIYIRQGRQTFIHILLT